MKRFAMIIGLLFALILLGCVPAMALSDDSFSIGLGTGIPYGGGIVGGNLNFEMGDYMEVTLGVGLAPYKWGYDAGLRLYLMSPENRFRLRASVFYGTNEVVYDLFWDTTLYNGVTAGLGGKYTFGRGERSAFAFDILYIVNSPQYEAEGYSIGNENERLRFSAGYVFQF
jgi:hypothetical protein